MDPIVQKFTDEFIDTTGDLRNAGDIEELQTRLEIPAMLVSKIRNPN